MIHIIIYILGTFVALWLALWLFGAVLGGLHQVFAWGFARLSGRWIALIVYLMISFWVSFKWGIFK